MPRLIAATLFYLSNDVYFQVRPPDTDRALREECDSDRRVRQERLAAGNKLIDVTLGAARQRLRPSS
jgi:hypothetical protein